MTGTLIIPPLGCAPCEATTEPAALAPEPLAHDGWWPGVDLTRLRAEARLRDSVTGERLRDAAIAAMIWVGEQLAAWQIVQLAAGHVELAAVLDIEIAGERRLAILYRQAVTAFAKASLVERYRDFDLTGAGERRVEELDASVGELRRDAIHAVRAILGRTRTDVELI